MKILVTGGAGFIGSNLVKRLFIDFKERSKQFFPGGKAERLRGGSGGADRRSGGVHGGGVERAAVLRHMKKAHLRVRFLRMVTFSPAQSSR